MVAEYEVAIIFKVPVRDSQEAYDVGQDIADLVYKKTGYDSYEPKVVEYD